MEKTKKELPELQKLSDTFKLIIPAKVEEKIRHLCRCVPDVEWSGKLFYRTEGSIANKDLVITCVDIYPMDIGSSGYTEFEETPDYFGYMVDKDLMDTNVGLIHSHNIMSTFFSGTDTATLREEGNDNNHFVSLIVNNAGKYTAAVTRKVTTVMKVVATDSFRTFDDSIVTVEGQKEWEESEDTIEYYMLDIEKEEVPGVLNELDMRLNEIRKAKAEKAAKKRTFSNTFNEWNLRGDSYIDRFKDHSFLDKRENWNQPSLFDDTPKTIISESQQVENEEDGIDFEVTPELVDDIATRLITGSILISGNSKVDLKKFVGSMESLYDKRFPDDPDLILFTEWADKLVDFLFMECIPGGLTDEHESECNWELSQAVIDRLNELRGNSSVRHKYIDVIISVLENKI